MLNIIVAKLLYLLRNIIPVLVIAVIIANILSESGIIRRFSGLLSPIIRFANLSEESALAIITYIASGSAGSAMLAGFHERKAISENETIIASFVSSFFSFINHLFVYFIPVVLPLLGLTAGVLYISARLFVSFCVTATAVIAGHFMLEGRVKEPIRYKSNRITKETLKSALEESWNILKKILPRLVVVFLITAVLNAYGLFEPLKEFRFWSFPGETSAIVAVGLADTTSAFVLAGSMLTEGLLTPVQAVSALLLASIVSMSVILVRHSLPGRIAYFGVRLGLKIAILSSLLNLIYTVVALLLILMF